MIEIKITGETAQDTLNDLASLAASFGAGGVVSVSVSGAAAAAATTTKSKTKTKADPDPAAPAANNTVTPKFKLEELQELNGKVDDKLAVKKLVNAFFYTDPATNEKKSVERMTQLEAKDYDTYAAHVQLLIDTQV